MINVFIGSAPSSRIWFSAHHTQSSSDGPGRREPALYDVPGMATEELVFFLVACAGLLVPIL